jgi:hypothetical protein
MPWQRNLPPSKTERRRREPSRKLTRQPRPIPLDSRRSASFTLRHFLWNWSPPARRCQRPPTRPLNLSLGNPQPGMIVSLSEGPLTPAVPSQSAEPNPPEPPSGAVFESMASKFISYFVKPFRTTGFQSRNHSSLHKQMAGRNTWCHPIRERGLEQCLPALKYATCLQSLPWPKS